MNIPDYAVEAMQKAEEETDPAWAIYWTQRSQALSQIALVEAQEAANELARIANLIALAGNNEAGRVADKAAGALTWSDGDNLRPEIARALGIPTGRRIADHE